MARAEDRGEKQKDAVEDALHRAVCSRHAYHGIHLTMQEADAAIARDWTRTRVGLQQQRGSIDNLLHVSALNSAPRHLRLRWMPKPQALDIGGNRLHRGHDAGLEKSKVMRRCR